MKKQKALIDFSSISEMLSGDQKFIKEFAEAAVLSFQEFSENYSKFLISQDETEFRKAGHKIKPVAKMLGLNQIVDEYESEKSQFGKEETEALEEKSRKMTEICDQVLIELNEIITAN
ncbi:MAG: taurine dioxygenase [Balneolaceae bacterium]